MRSATSSVAASRRRGRARTQTTRSGNGGSRPEDRKTLAQRLAVLFGSLFLLVGILGFVPGITANYDELELAGPESRAELLGLFRVSVLHNVAHLLFGIGILAARRHRSALQFLLAAGVVYVVLLAYGLLASERGSENFLPTNTGDDVLHAILAVALVGSWAAARGAGRAQPPP